MDYLWSAIVHRILLAVLLSMLFSVGAQATPREDPIQTPATIVVKEYRNAENSSATRCVLVPFLVFSDRSKVTFSSVTYFDTYYQDQKVRSIAAPFDDDFALQGVPDGEFDASGAEHQISLAFISTTDDELNPSRCSDSKAYLQNRFLQPYVSYIPNQDNNTISGVVSEWVCTAYGIESIRIFSAPPFLPERPDAPFNAGCVKRGVENIVVRARPIGTGVGASSRTDESGYYELDVRDGRYSVKPRVRKHDFSPSSTRVQIRGNRATEINFSVRGAAVQKLSARRRRPKPSFSFVRGGGRVKICNRDPFFHEYSSPQTLDYGRQRPEICRTRRLPTNTGEVPVGYEIFCALHHREVAVVWTLPE